jgi:hypothetical protein
MSSYANKKNTPVPWGVLFFIEPSEEVSGVEHTF